MRDPDRIPVILDELKEYWIQNPDLRLGQIISNFGGYAGAGRDPSNVEDEDMLQVIRDELDAMEKKNESIIPGLDDCRYDLDDIDYYLNQIHDIIDKTPLEDKLDRALEDKPIVVVKDGSIADESIQIIGERLEAAYDALTRIHDERFEERCRKQRSLRGYSDKDVWNFWYWFVSTVKPMLEQLAEEHMGYPSSIDRQYFEEHKAELSCDSYMEWVSRSPEEESEKHNEKHMATEECSKRWTVILKRMVFLMGEMDEETCSIKNPYQKEVDVAFEEFHNKYGFFGEGLKSKEEIEEESKTHAERVLFPTDEPGREDIKELFKKYHKEEENLWEYKEKCKDEFFRLLSEYFFEIWD